MLIARTREELAAAMAALRQDGRGVGLVPTMGALHDGHLSLVAQARAACGQAAASIFVNPTQFAPHEDFARYPRDEAGDLDKLRAAGCGLAWLPGVADIYPHGDATMIEVAGPAQGWEGARRPGHFRGVATVVAKLFGLARPDAAVFGEKDWQQLQVINRMVADLALPVRVIGAAVVREADGLAMSSRNRYLTAGERAVAPVVHASLVGVRAALARGIAAADALADGEAALAGHGLAVDYLALVEGESLVETREVTPGARLIVAAKLGAVRLLDNIAAA
jgi:pantoate--beta-alanine ligase